MNTGDRGMRAFSLQICNTLYLYNNNICGNISLFNIHHSLFFVFYRTKTTSNELTISKAFFTLVDTKSRNNFAVYILYNFHSNIANMANMENPIWRYHNKKINETFHVWQHFWNLKLPWQNNIWNNDTDRDFFPPHQK